MWFSLVDKVLSIFTSLTEYFGRQQLIDCGRSKKLAEDLKVVRKRIHRAINARNNVGLDGMHDSKYNRDNKGKK